MAAEKDAAKACALVSSYRSKVPTFDLQCLPSFSVKQWVCNGVNSASILERGPPYCDCDGCDRMSKRGLRMRAGWRHDWNSTGNEFVRVIIPGPFSEPALVTSSPFVFLSTDHRVRRRDDCSRYFPAHQRRCAILRSGIPDPWAEYLTLRGVPQVCRRANPEEVHLWRDHLDHVESLWGRLGLSLAQGIPDPWKNWPKCCSSPKRRPDACQSLTTRSPRTCRNRSNSCDSFLMQREAELPFYDCGDPKDMRAKSDSVLICKPIKKNECHGPKFNIDECNFTISHLEPSYAAHAHSATWAMLRMRIAQLGLRVE
uniref:Uncharacterized protein n=1 Tax=Timema bartmani TaxID=61472 RepID=A0A7R9HWM6_9NEOP|nr:unnamed protein product [Timema bartmani]